MAMKIWPHRSVLAIAGSHDGGHAPIATTIVTDKPMAKLVETHCPLEFGVLFVGRLRVLAGDFRNLSRFRCAG
jgi:hypothetical protein